MYFLQSPVISTSLSFLEKIKDIGFTYLPKLLGAALVYLIGSWVIKKICNITRGILLAKKYDPSLQSFLTKLIEVLLTVLLIISVLGMIGVETSSFAALIAGAGIAIGAALNGTLGNFSGGVMMLIFKPFKIGDMIEAQGQTGVVTEQGIFNTTVLTADNKTVIVPNGPLSTGIITNYTAHGNLRVDLMMAISSDQDIDKARQVAITAMLQHPKVLHTPAPEVSVLKVADFMVTLAIRPYCIQQDYWDVYFGAQELVKKAFDTNGVTGPVPTRIIINK
jgi:small conductance mechanosensitive channel